MHLEKSLLTAGLGKDMRPRGSRQSCPRPARPPACVLPGGRLQQLVGGACFPSTLNTGSAPQDEALPARPIPSPSARAPAAHRLGRAASLGARPSGLININGRVGLRGAHGERAFLEAHGVPGWGCNGTPRPWHLPHRSPIPPHWRARPRGPAASDTPFASPSRPE